MVDTPRQVTGESQGVLLAQLLNQDVDKRDRWARLLQQELEQVFTGVATLTVKLPASDPGVDWPDEVKKALGQLNAFLRTCAQYPFVLPVRSPGTAPFLMQDFRPVTAGAMRHNAMSAICALVRYGLLDRVQRCQRCGIWFFAKKSDSKYCSRDCQTKPTDESKLRKREYAKHRYRKEKEQEQRAKLKVRDGVRK